MTTLRHLITCIICLLAATVSVDAQSIMLREQLAKPDHSLSLASVGLWKPQLPILAPNPVQEKAEAAREALDSYELPEYVADMISYSRTFLGTRYRIGGKKPGGFDCSGFTGYIFRQFGIELLASSRAQYTQGDVVTLDCLQPGDLVFFNGRRAGGKSVGHVGIVTDVNADGTFRFIHSSCTSGVVISNSTEPYYHRRYVGARRVTSE